MSLGLKINGNGAAGGSFLPTVLYSLLFHVLFFAGMVLLAKVLYKSEAFERPQTFQLVRLTPEAPAAQASVVQKARPVKQNVSAAKPKAAMPPEVRPAPVAEQTPVPAKQEAAAQAPVEQAAPAQASGAPQAASTGPAISPDMVYEEAATDQPATVVARPKIFYPEVLQEQGIGGIVQVLVTVDKDGSVLEFKILKSPHEFLSDEVSKAITRYKFKPAKLKGVLVKQRGKIEIKFVPGKED